MSSLVGIDLGTTNSLCAAFVDGAPRLVKSADGGWLTPSVVGVLDDGHILVGRAAADLRVTHPEMTAACFKRRMGTDEPIRIGRRLFTAPELSALVLKALVRDAESDLGGPVEEAVVTVPAYFNEHQRRATKLAGELAGLKVRRIVNEPTAAALAYGFHDRHAEKSLLVVDLGGGTFDVTVMEVFEGTLEIVSTAGESFLGGEDFTDKLIALALGHCGLSLEAAELKQPLRVARLRAECERAKLGLTETDRAAVRMPEADGTLSPEATVVELTRAEFAAAAEALMRRLSGPLDRALRDAEKRPANVDEIILVGGATRMPLVREFVRERFGREPLAALDPDHVVALGAAVQTALIEDLDAVEDMVMTDVCPFTLGVEVVKEFGSMVQEGYYLPVIHRNTTIPVSREEVVATIQRNQREVRVRIFQGEGRRVEDNLLLGELKVTGLPAAPRGLPVHLRFTYDLNGILEVEAYVPESGQKYRTVLHQHVKGLSPKEIDRAVQNLQTLKFYPRDDLRNQQLIRFAERVVGEVNPLRRQVLEDRIDALEEAMASRDREQFEDARRDLLILLSELGFPADDPTESEHENP